MIAIEELIGADATAELKERYGRLVDWIFVEEREPAVFKMILQLVDWKRMSAKPSDNEIKRTIGLGVAEIEQALYSVLNFDGGNMEQGFHFNNNLPRNGIYMHRETYKELMWSEKETMRRIEERLKRLRLQG